jgi:hypothetical protein
LVKVCLLRVEELRGRERALLLASELCGSNFMIDVGKLERRDNVNNLADDSLSYTAKSAYSETGHSRR